MPGASARPQPCVQNKKHTSVVTTVTPETPGIPRAMVLTVSFALSLVNRACCHHPRRDALGIIGRLTPASGRQDHTTSPSANPRSRRKRFLRPPHPVLYVRDDREPPLL
jgi:hypothetical protein